MTWILNEHIAVTACNKIRRQYNHPWGSPHVLKRKISILKENCTIIERNFNEKEYTVLLSSFNKRNTWWS